VAEPRLRLSLDVTAVPSRPVGAGQYTLELAGALASRVDVDLVLIGRRTDGSRWRSVAPTAEVVPVAPGARPLRLAWEQVRLPALLTKQAVSVHHGPHYTMPERASVPSVVTIHDMSFFEEARWHERSKVLVFRRAIAVAARKAAAVVCPSRVTAAQLARWCRVETEVFVAPHGVDTGRFGPEEPEPGADRAVLAAVDPRLADGRPFLVFVGTLEPRKDIPTLVRAFARIAGHHRDAVVVLAGGVGWGADAVDQAVVASGVASRIIRTGYVPDPVVPALLRASAGAVYPALYEGFGLPALEALACGAPLITTSGTAMEEVAGGAAVLVEPGDVGGLADALDARLAQPSASAPGRSEQDQRQRGFDIVARHTWAASAARHMEAYRAAARRPAARGDAAPGTQPVG
jgi:glycosyltransferase involved in cell wall biosynthesis